MDLEIIVKSLNSPPPVKEEETILSNFKSSVQDTFSKTLQNCTNTANLIQVDALNQTIFDNHHVQLRHYLSKSISSDGIASESTNQEELSKQLQMSCAEIAARVMLQLRNPQLSNKFIMGGECGFFSDFLNKAIVHAEKHRARDHILEKEYGSHLSGLCNDVSGIEDKSLMNLKHSMPPFCVPLAPLFRDAVKLSMEKVHKLENIFHRCRLHMKPKSGMIKRDISIKELNSLRRSLHKTRNRVLKHAFKRGRSYKVRQLKRCNQPFALPEDVEKDFEEFMMSLFKDLISDEKSKEALVDVYSQLGYKMDECNLIEHLEITFRQLLTSFFTSEKSICNLGGVVSEMNDDDNDLQMDVCSESILQINCGQLGPDERRLVSKVGWEILTFDRELFGSCSQLNPQPNNADEEAYYSEEDADDSGEDNANDMLQYQQEIMELNMPSEYFDLGDLDMTSIEVLEDLDMNNTDGNCMDIYQTSIPLEESNEKLQPELESFSDQASEHSSSSEQSATLLKKENVNATNVNAKLNSIVTKSVEEFKRNLHSTTIGSGGPHFHRKHSLIDHQPDEVEKMCRISTKVDTVASTFVEHVDTVMSTLLCHFDSHQSIQDDFFVDANRERERLSSQSILLGRIGNFSNYFLQNYLGQFPHLLTKEPAVLGGEKSTESGSWKQYTPTTTKGDGSGLEPAPEPPQLKSPLSSPSSRILELARWNTNKSNNTMQDAQSGNKLAVFGSLSPTTLTSPKATLLVPPEMGWKNRKVCLLDSSSEDFVTKSIQAFLRGVGANFYDPMSHLQQINQPVHILVHGHWRRCLIETDSCFISSDGGEKQDSTSSNKLLFNLLKLKNCSLVHILSFHQLTDVTADQCIHLFPHGFTCLVLDLSALTQLHPVDLRELLEFMVKQKSEGRVWHLKMVPSVLEKWQILRQNFTPSLRILADQTGMLLNGSHTLNFTDVVHLYQHSTQQLTLPTLLDNNLTNAVPSYDFMSSYFALPCLQYMLHMQEDLQLNYRHFCLISEVKFSEDIVQTSGRHGISVMSMTNLLETKLKRSAMQLFPDAMSCN